MLYQFTISGFDGRYSIIKKGRQQVIEEAMKKQARRASHRVIGCDERVGPKVSYGLYLDGIHYQDFEEKLSRRQVVFGVPYPDLQHRHTINGFQGLCRWLGPATNGLSYILVDMKRASQARVENWVLIFMRSIIHEAGWTIEDEGDLIAINQRNETAK